MKSSNPVLGRMSASAQQPRYQVPGGGYGYGGYGDGGYGAPVDVATNTYTDTVRGTEDVMTLDDVVVKTAGLLGLTILSAAVTYLVLPPSMYYAAWIGAAVVGLVVGLIIQFAQLLNPIAMGAYAVIEGVLVGAASATYAYLYHGIVPMAAAATLGTFLVMVLAYKSKVIRATPKFMKVVSGIAMGLGVVMLINLGVFLFTGSATFLRDGGPIAIGFSLICITVAALMLVVSFQQIEDGVRAGLPRKYGWLGAFGILVEVVWMYLEFLRLLSYFADGD